MSQAHRQEKYFWFVLPFTMVAVFQNWPLADHLTCFICGIPEKKKKHEWVQDLRDTFALRILKRGVNSVYRHTVRCYEDWFEFTAFSWTWCADQTNLTGTTCWASLGVQETFVSVLAQFLFLWWRMKTSVLMWVEQSSGRCDISSTLFQNCAWFLKSNI